MVEAAHPQPPQHEHCSTRLCMALLGFTWTSGLFPAPGKHKLCFGFLFPPLNNNQGKRDVPVVRGESGRAQEGALQ